MTDDKDDIAAIATFVSGLPIGPLGTKPSLELLNFNPMAESKYLSLGIPYRLKGSSALPDDALSRLKDVVREQGCHVI